MVGTNLGSGVLPADGVIQVAFDRYLLPTTIRRQSYAVLDGRNELVAIPDLVTTYDPIARTVSIRGPGAVGTPWLTPDLSYKLVLLVPQDEQNDNGGFRALDRAALAPAQTREFVFRAGPASGQKSYEPAIDYCTDVVPIFFRKCDGATCHGPSTLAAAGLVLTTPAGLGATAIGRIAHGATTGAHASTIESAPTVFGVNMKLIEPGDPGASWLLYKVELPPPPTVRTTPVSMTCVPPAGSIPPPPAGLFAPLASPVQSDASPGERSILSDYLTGPPMPYPSVPEANIDPRNAYSAAALTFQEREQIRIWIANGAATRDCGGCGYL